MQCDKCGYDDKGTGDFAHSCGQLIMTNHQDKELSRVIGDLLHAFWLHYSQSEEQFERMPEVKAARALATSPQLPVAEQPAGQAATFDLQALKNAALAVPESQRDWSLKAERTITDEYDCFLWPSRIHLHDNVDDAIADFLVAASPARILELIAALDKLSAAPHSPVAQMSGDEAIERAVTDAVAVGNKHNVSPIVTARIIAAYQTIALHPFTAASHPSNAAIADAYTRGRADGWEAAKLKYAANAVQDAPVVGITDAQRDDIAFSIDKFYAAQNQIASDRDRCDEEEQQLWDLYQESIDRLTRLAASRPAATVPQVAQSVPKTEAWLIESYDANDKLRRRVVLAPLTDDTYLDESAEAIALCRVEDAAPQPVAASPSIVPSGEQAAWQAVAWDRFPAWLIDHCEGQTITEEGLQQALSAMLAHDKANNCPKCGADWLKHDFGVPYPDCPDTTQQAAAASSIVPTYEQLRELVLEAMDIQYNNYGNGVRTHLAFIDWAKKACALLTTASNAGEAAQGDK